MNQLTIGERVLITSGISSFWHQVGRIVKIFEPFVADRVKETALFEMPLYFVRLDDGRSFRFRGRDLERVSRQVT